MTDRRPFEGAWSNLIKLRTELCGATDGVDCRAHQCSECIFSSGADPELFREWLKGLINREEGDQSTNGNDETR